MTKDLIDYYARLNEQRMARHLNTDQRTYGEVIPVVSLYKPRHKREL